MKGSRQWLQEILIAGCLSTKPFGIQEVRKNCWLFEWHLTWLTIAWLTRSCFHQMSRASAQLYCRSRRSRWHEYISGFHWLSMSFPMMNLKIAPKSKGSSSEMLAFRITYKIRWLGLMGTGISIEIGIFGATNPCNPLQKNWPLGL